MARSGSHSRPAWPPPDTYIRAALRPGDHLILPDDAYGGTFRLVDKICVPWGLTYSTVSLGDLDAVRAAIRPATRVIWCETPTNPLLGIADIAALAELAHGAGAQLLVDNTFASPYLQQPLALGADAVLHSTTKYIGGHSDVIGGALVVEDAELAEALAFHSKSMGAVPGPVDSWLTLRGVKTLAVRMDRHCDNAERVVELLVGHPRVARVYYPGLPAHPGHDIAARQMRRFGGMVSFSVVGGQEEALKVCRRTRLFTLAESLGGVESLIEHPGPDDPRQRRGLGPAGAGRPDPAVRRHRGRRRSAGRPARRVGLTRAGSARLGQDA